jgi:hypothetical protein
VTRLFWLTGDEEEGGEEDARACVDYPMYGDDVTKITHFNSLSHCHNVCDIRQYRLSQPHRAGDRATVDQN